jgi:hypothetical protein
MIPREILKQIRPIELRPNRIATAAATGSARIPTGFRPKAQGCEERATLGNMVLKSQPQRGCVRPASLASTPMALWGFRQITQGCEARAALGQRPANSFNRNAVAALPFSSAAREVGRNPVGVVDDSFSFTQGSSYVATLGYMPESLWDSPMAAIGQSQNIIPPPTGLRQTT